MHKASSEKPNSKKKSINYLSYAGMAFQMGFIIILGTLAGKWLDAKYATERPWFTLGCTFLALILAFYYTIKDLIRKR